jgi:tetratricopeptide (TPR) repeat protein
VFHRGAVAALAPDDPDVSSLLLGLVRKELVRPSPSTLPGDDAYRFRHLLIRDAAYDALPKAERAALHERFAVWLAEHAPSLVELDEIVGYHLEQAARYRSELGDPSPALQERAAEPLARAGVRAGEREDPNASLTLLRRASELFEPDDPRRLRLLPDIARALYALGRLDDAYGELDEAIDRADPDTAAHAFFFRLVAQGHGESLSPFDVERDAREKLASVEGSAGERTLAVGYWALAWGLYWLGRPNQAIETTERAVALAQRAGDRAIEVDALRLIQHPVKHGDVAWSEIDRYAERMAAVGLDPAMLVGTAAANLGRFDEARRLFDQFARDERERGRMMTALFVGLWRSDVEFLAGDYGTAAGALRESWDGLGELGEKGVRSTIGGVLGAALARDGRLAEAEAVLDEAIAMGTLDDWATVSEVGIGRAFLASGRGEHDRACDLAREAVEILDAHEYLTLQQAGRLAYGEILLAAGRLDEARAELLRAREVGARKGSTALVAKVDELLEAT